jgi:nucleoside-diphosphate-sugar epimerase
MTRFRNINSNGRFEYLQPDSFAYIARDKEKTMTIDKNTQVLVTGATGYVAGLLVKKILDEGHTVHAAVRDPDNVEKIQYLKKAADSAPGQLRFFKSDLLETGSYAEAMEGCEVVFHTASPFILSVKDPQKELIAPAKQGTRNVLEQANKTPSVKRVVVTSSCAAVYGDNADLEKTENGMFTEADWNTSASENYLPYSYSKTLAEKEAWAISEKQDRWDLVTVNPSFVLGPGLNPNGTSESFAIIKQIGDGSMKSGIPRMGMGIVDVRDLADAHYKAGFSPTAKGRYIVSGHNSDLFDVALILHAKFGDRFPIPNKAVPKPLAWLIGPLLNKALNRKYISRNINLPWRADNSKGIKELGLSYRPLEETVIDFFEFLVDAGMITPPR